MLIVLTQVSSFVYSGITNHAFLVGHHSLDFHIGIRIVEGLEPNTAFENFREAFISRKELHLVLSCFLSMSGHPTGNF